MTGRTRAMAVALAVLVVAVLLAGCADDRIEVTAVFDDAGDLQARGSVQVADVRVGEIGAIRLTDDFKAKVTLHIDGDVAIPADSVALLRTTSLLGEKFVELRPRGEPDEGPFLRDGARIDETREAPELEFVAEQAVTVLGAVAADDVATLIQSGAESFGGRETELRSLIGSLETISDTLARRSGEITRIIDGFDATAGRLAAGSGDVGDLLANLAETTRVLAENRDRAVSAIEQVTRLAAVQNGVIGRYRADIDRQIKQADDIVRIAAGETAELALVLDWLERFTLAIPKVIPQDMTQVFMWVIPAELDPRVDH